VRIRQFFLPLLFSVLLGLAAHAQVPQQKPVPKSTTLPPAQTPAQETIQSPVSRHYPILIVAHGNEPSWSLRLGMKGPERLDRAGYPPIILDRADIVVDQADPSGNSWTYNAKDDATAASVSVKLTREPCSDNMSDAKYTFRVEVDHAQIGQLKGCGQSEPEKFPEFRKKNQLDMPDDASDTSAKDKEKDKKLAVLDPIINSHPPVAVAYLDSAGRIIVARGNLHKTAGTGSEPALSHDGRFLLYTRSASPTAPQRSIMLYEVDTGRSTQVAGDNVRQSFWSPDDSHFAYLKYDGKNWQIWTAPTNAPDQATLFSPQYVDSLHGYVTPNTLLASDMQNAYFFSEDKPPQTVPLKDIYGETFQIMSSDTLRVNPLNPDLLLVSAYYVNAPAGAPTDQVGLNETFFLYEIRSRRRTILGPPDTFARNAEWSRDGLQILFTRGVPGKSTLSTDRIFWDTTGLKRYSSGYNLVIGK
jgi:uncharacterized membrane protein